MANRNFKYIRNKYTERDKKLYKLFQFAKRFPAYGVDRIFGITLPTYQIDMISRGWNKMFPLYLCSRRTGKSYVIANLLSLKALLYPNTKIGLVAPVYRQSKNVFKMCEEIRKGSPFYLSQSKTPRHSNSEWVIDFHNGSSIICVPLSDNIRSYGFTIVHIDEYSFREGMNQDVDSIIKPMLITKQELRTGKDLDETNIGNQLIISSTAKYEGSDFHKLILEYQEEINKGDKDYDIISYDYRDGLQSGLFNRKMVMKQINTMDTHSKKMEYLNVFLSSSGGFVTLELIDNKVYDKKEQFDPDTKKYTPPETQIEFQQKLDENGKPIYKYYLSFDDADQGNDNFSYALFKIDGNVKRLVQIYAMNNAPIQEKIRKIRELLRNFNIIGMCGDQRHKNITDNLAEKYYYPDGEVGEPILIKGDEEQLEYIKRQYGSDVDYRDIISIHNFSANTNELRARHLLSEMEKGRVKFPAPIGVDSKKESKYYAEIQKTVGEILSIEPQPAGKYIQYMPRKGRKARKDRWTVTELGVYMIDEWIKNDLGSNEEDLFVGCKFDSNIFG